MVSQVHAEVGDGWGFYGGNERGLQYSSADQINPRNVAGLKETWRFRTGEMSEGARDGYSFQATPMTYVVDGKQYVVIAAGGHKGAGTTPGDYVVALSL